MSPALFQIPFVQIALPIMFTMLLTVWVNNKAFDGSNRRMDDLNRRMDDMRSDFNKRFDGTDRRFDEVIKGLDRIETKLDDHEKRIVRVEERTSPVVRG